MNAQTQNFAVPKKVSTTNSLLELCKLFFAFLVLKDHGFTWISKQLTWFAPSSIAVEFFFVAMGWFLIRGITRHQEQYQQLGLWRSWWIYFKKKLKGYLIPCLIPCLACNMLCLFYSNGIPNGILWMYYFVHEAFIVMFIYYVIFYKVKDEHTRLIWMIWLFIGATALRFTLVALVENVVMVYEFPRALSSMTLGILCAKIPKVQGKKVLAWLTFFVSLSAVVTITVLPAEMMFGINKPIIKDAINYFIFPVLIYSCIWTGFSWGPLNYIGSWSKGLYMWQMVPWTIMVIGQYYKIPQMQEGWILMIIAIGLTVLEDPIRRIVKHCQHGQLKNNPKWIKTKENYSRIYNKRETQICLFALALSCLAGGVAMGLFGAIEGFMNNMHFDWFFDPTTNRNTFFCRGLMLLIAAAPVIGLFPLNYHLTKKEEKKYGK